MGMYSIFSAHRTRISPKLVNVLFVPDTIRETDFLDLHGSTDIVIYNVPHRHAKRRQHLAWYT